MEAYLPELKRPITQKLREVGQEEAAEPEECTSELEQSQVT
jgi:hypothetical protein